jgi:hypothetical protein
MRTIGEWGHEFPDTPAEGAAWQPTFQKKALHRQVLVVAKTRIEGAWNAYIFPVEGKSHEAEWPAWETEGVKLQEDTARTLFGYFGDGLPYAH